MRLTTLDLDDFGCFRGARMRDIDDELVVIGGPQRAGKTTFMQAIRQLRGGVRRGDDLPPETDTYRIDAELVHDGGAYRLTLDRFADPQLSPLDGAEPITPDELFDGIDRIEFQKLYTLSLRELQLLPPGIDDPEDLSKILLGAAYGEIAKIPELKDHFAGKADDIGLSKGNPATKTSEFHGPYSQIQEGLDDLGAANDQVDEYHELAEKHRETVAEIETVEDHIDEAESELERLRILRAEHDDVRRYRTLARDLEDEDVRAARAFPDAGVQRAERLSDSFDDAVEAVSDARGAFETQIGEAWTGYQATLLDHRSELESYDRERSGWTEQVDSLREDADQLERRREDLERQVSDLRPEWGASLEHIAGIDTSVVTADRVNAAADELTTATHELEERQGELESKRSQYADLREEREQLEASGETADGTHGVVYRFLGVAATAVLAGIAGSHFVSPAVGLGIAFAVLVGGGYHLQRSLAGTPRGDVQPVRELRARAAQLEAEIETLESEIETAKDERETARDEVETVRETVGVPADVSPEGVAEFYAAVARLQDEAAELETAERRHERRRNELARELDDVATTIGTIRSVDWNADAPIDTAPNLFAAIRTSVDHLEYAIDLRDAQRERRDAIADCTALFDEWEAGPRLPDDPDDQTVRSALQTFVTEGEHAREIAKKAAERDELAARLGGRFERDAYREAFRDRREDDEEWLVVLERALDSYVDAEAIESDIDDVESRIEELKDRKDDLRETEVEQNQRLDDLKSDDDLIAAREQIDEARPELERLGEQYATYRIAESMMDRLHDQFIEEVAGSLLDDAGRIFSRITEEYTGIELAGDLDDLDFRALRDGNPAHGRGELSRATAEQLFMAIRVAKIRQLDVELPMVLDDSMTNFDPQHCRRMLWTIDELTATNQVFLLTCHPELIEIVREHAETAQYWCLQDGRFTGPWETPDRLNTALQNGG